MTQNLKVSGYIKVLESGQARVNEPIAYTISNLVSIHNGTRYSIASGATEEITIPDESVDFIYISSDQSIRVAYDLDTSNPSTTFSVDASTDIITNAANKYFYTGLPVILTTTTTLPAGLALSTTYYYISRGALRGQLATSESNAEAGTQIDITDTGTGVHTITSSTAMYSFQIDEFAYGTLFMVAGTNTRKIYIKNPSSAAAEVYLWAYRD